MTDKSPTPLILPHKPEAEYYFKEGCYILEHLNDPRDPTVSIARARVLPGKATRWHRLSDTMERYLIQSGQGTVEVGDISRKVNAGDVVLIPAGCRQRIVNTGEDELVFLAICSPRFQSACYEDLGP